MDVTEWSNEMTHGGLDARDWSLLSRMSQSKGRYYRPKPWRVSRERGWARVSAGERGRARAAFWKSRGARAEKNAWLITYFNSLIILARILLEFDKLIRYGGFIAKFSRTFCVFWALVIHPTCQLADGRSGEGVGSVVSFPNIQIACLWKKSRMRPGKFLYYKKSLGRTERPSMSALHIRNDKTVLWVRVDVECECLQGLTLTIIES